MGYVDDALSDGASTLADAMMLGQVLERREVLDLVREWLSDNCDDVGGDS